MTKRYVNRRSIADRLTVGELLAIATEAVDIGDEGETPYVSGTLKITRRVYHDSNDYKGYRFNFSDKTRSVQIHKGSEREESMDLASSLFHFLMDECCSWVEDDDEDQTDQEC